MPPYNWMHLENAWWMIAGGLAIAALIILARGATFYRLPFSRPPEGADDEKTTTFPDNLKERYGPAPLFIWLIVISYLIWSAVYVVYFGKRGL